MILERFPSLKPEQIIIRDDAQYRGQLQAALQFVNREGFDIVLDAISGEFFQPSYDAMARGGRHVIFGAANWTPTGRQHALSPNVPGKHPRRLGLYAVALDCYCQTTAVNKMQRCEAV